MNPDPPSIATLVKLLSSQDSSAREFAGRELYHRGRDLAEQAIAGWRESAEIGALISRQATVGIAVTPRNFAAIRSATGNSSLADVPPDQDADEFEWSLGDDVHLDILTTRQPGGPGAIARFLAKHGEGIQQVEFLTADIDRVTESLRSRLGAAPVYPSARAGAGGTRVNFFLASAPNGEKALIEMVEPRQKP